MKDITFSQHTVSLVEENDGIELTARFSMKQCLCATNAVLDHAVLPREECIDLLKEGMANKIKIALAKALLESITETPSIVYTDSAFKDLYYTLTPLFNHDFHYPIA